MTRLPRLGIRFVRKTCLAFGDRRVQALTPEWIVGRSLVARVREDLEQAEQHLEMVGFALDLLAELRGDGERIAAIGCVAPRPGTNDIGVTGGLDVGFLVVPAFVGDGAQAASRVSAS